MIQSTTNIIHHRPEQSLLGRSTACVQFPISQSQSCSAPKYSRRTGKVARPPATMILWPALEAHPHHDSMAVGSPPLGRASVARPTDKYLEVQCGSTGRTKRKRRRGHQTFGPAITRELDATVGGRVSGRANHPLGHLEDLRPKYIENVLCNRDAMEVNAGQPDIRARF